MQVTGLVFSPQELKERRLCLDFANTVEWRDTDHPDESINSYTDLLDWSLKKELLHEDDLLLLTGEAERRPKDTDDALERFFTLREATYRIFSAFANNRTARESDFAIFNSELSRMMAHSGIIRSKEGFAWKYTGDRGALDRMLWPVLLDAAYLLTSDMLKRIGECAGDGCTWFFIDKSRNRSRQWCAMDDCGNRAKARRFYQRKQAARRK